MLKLPSLTINFNQQKNLIIKATRNISFEDKVDGTFKLTVDAGTGQVIFNDNGDAKGYPASVIKLMDLLIILENVKQGTVKLTDRVSVAPEAANVGGSQAYLKKANSGMGTGA